MLLIMASRPVDLRAMAENVFSFPTDRQISEDCMPIKHFSIRSELFSFKCESFSLVVGHLPRWEKRLGSLSGNESYCSVLKHM